jgi:hypothetical protein
MRETFDEMKGRTKEAGDAAGTAKDLADKAGDRLKDAFDR